MIHELNLMFGKRRKRYWLTEYHVKKGGMAFYLLWGNAIQFLVQFIIIVGYFKAFGYIFDVKKIISWSYLL